MTEQFHIAEWYGHPFLALSDEERLKLADHKVGSPMKKSEIDRLTSLRTKQLSSELSLPESKRLADLEGKLEEQQRSEQPCPFRTDVLYPTCTKVGGVCSIRLVSDVSGKVAAIEGERGMVRALCPYRFHQNDEVFRHIGDRLLNDPNPKQIGEVGFLESTGNLDSEPGEDVGRIDMVLVKSNSQEGMPLQWVAVEIQAVYFSGPEMSLEFKQLKVDGGRASMPAANRRPDYRSSGPKRLMPQLQIKVPTLRRWGKKMAIVVDKPFFLSMGQMAQVKNVSNSDIIWYLVDFLEVDGKQNLQITVVDEIATTLESSIEGLTGGVPVSLEQFEQKILGKN